MKISKKELIEMKACSGGLKRFIRETSNTDDSVDVASLVGGKNNYSDLLWLAGEKLDKSRVVRFACDCALLNIELIKQYTDKYNLIVEFLKNPTRDAADYASRPCTAARVYAAAARAARAYACTAARASARAHAAARAARAARAAYTTATYATYAATYATYAATEDYADGDPEKVTQLLIDMFNEVD